VPEKDYNKQITLMASPIPYAAASVILKSITKLVSKPVFGFYLRQFIKLKGNCKPFSQLLINSTRA
jgi:hypothetical protein